MHKLRHLRAGFTLIELLIVVAIIAILAAIAVPNFLEAQVRAKVSRVKSDMRSIATAIESYVVDLNKYPVAYLPGPATVPGAQRLAVLTTPVAYMTAIPIDTFGKGIPEAGETIADARAFIYADKASYKNNVPAWDANTNADNGFNYYRFLWRDAGQYPAVPWLLRSRGPVGTGAGIGTAIDKRDQYDPTNGTVSVGNVFYLGGIGPL